MTYRTYIITNYLYNILIFIYIYTHWHNNSVKNNKEIIAYLKFVKLFNYNIYMYKFYIIINLSKFFIYIQYLRIYIYNNYSRSIYLFNIRKSKS